MAKQQIVAGIDIGSSKVVCVIATQNEQDSIEIIGVGRVPYANGMKRGGIVNVPLVGKAIGEAVGIAKEMSGVTVDRVSANIKGFNIKSVKNSAVYKIQSHDNKEITADDVKKVIESTKAIQLPADWDVIQTIIKDFEVDGQKGITNPIGMDGTLISVDALLITGTVSLINNLIKCIHSAEYSLNKIISSVVAAGEATVSQDEKNIGCILIDMGAQTTDIAFYYDGSIQEICELQVGGDDITLELAGALQTTFRTAQEIKEKYGSARKTLIELNEEVSYIHLDGQTEISKTKKEISDFIRPKIQELLEDILKEIRKILPDKRLLSSGIVITGGASRLTGMKEACNIILERPVRLGLPRDVSGTDKDINDPALACAIGLVKYSDLMDIDEISGQFSGGGKIFKGIKNWFKNFFEAEL